MMASVLTGDMACVYTGYVVRRPDGSLKLCAPGVDGLAVPVIFASKEAAAEYGVPVLARFENRVTLLEDVARPAVG